MNIKICSVIRLLRPHQWLKNLILFFPPFLGGTLLNQGETTKGVVSFILFCFASSAGYILNDLMDLVSDQNHPNKNSRPLASGKVSVTTAKIIALLLVSVSVVAGFSVSKVFVTVLVVYLSVSVAYSCCLKNLPIVDLFCVASVFLLRLIAGGNVFNVRISEWLFLSVLLLSLFLSAGKRASEKQLLADTAGGHRKVLEHYPQGFLDGVLFMTGSASLVTYTMYTLSHRVLLYSVPLCCFGLLRYIFVVKSGQGGDPTDALLHDYQLLITSVLWMFLVGWSIYW